MVHTTGVDDSNEGAFGAGLRDLGAAESQEQVAARYDEWTHEYEHDVRSWGYIVPEVLADMVGDAPDLPILDAGCGTGLCGDALRARLGDDASITGIDASPESIAVASASGHYAAATVADLTATLPFADKEFGTIVCGGVLTYIDDTLGCLQELLRVTRPGGRVIFTQRTDKWIERDCDAVIRELVGSGRCTAHVGEPQAYLPGLADYGNSIKVIYTVLTK